MTSPLLPRVQRLSSKVKGVNCPLPMLCGGTIGFLFSVLLPFIHFGIISHLWDEYNFSVDTVRCTCPCWDTIFKGIYERGPGGYKHVYFNVTANSFKIWCVTVLAVIFLYEASKKVVNLLFINEVRWSMLLLLGLSIYPHYYSWWSYFNYWNDGYYDQWNHQLFFSFTELMSTLVVLHLVDRRKAITSKKVLTIMCIAIVHVLASSFDQFVENVVRGSGMLHQVLRDIFFMIPDLILIAVPLYELKIAARNEGIPTSHMINSVDFIMSVAFVLSGWFMCILIL